MQFIVCQKSHVFAADLFFQFNCLVSVCYWIMQTCLAGSCLSQGLFMCSCPQTETCRTNQPLSSDRQHLSYDVYLEVRGEVIRTVLCCTVYWSCAQSWVHLDEQFLQFSGLRFVTLGPFHRICLYLCVFCVFFFYTTYVLYYCECYMVDLIGMKPNP